MPEAVWLDLVRFDHWIEDSLVLQWAQVTAEMNPSLTTADVLPLLLATPDAKRDTAEVRSLLLRASVGNPMECVLQCEVSTGLVRPVRAASFRCSSRGRAWETHA